MAECRLLPWLKLFIEIIEMILAWTRRNQDEECAAQVVKDFMDSPDKVHTVHELVASLEAEPKTVDLARSIHARMVEAKLQA